MERRVDADIAKILPLLPLKDAANLTPKRARDELVALASLCVSHFCRTFRQICRAFRQTFGERPYAYIVRLRLQGAQELMLSGRDRLGQLGQLMPVVDRLLRSGADNDRAEGEQHV